MSFTRACSTSQSVQHIEARSSCMPVFYFGGARGSGGQKPLTTWLFCSGLFLTRECRRQLGQSALQQKRQLFWPLQTKCVGLLWSMSHDTLLLLQHSVLLFSVVLVPLQKFSSSCNSLMRVFSLHQVLREQTRATETFHYAVQTKLSVKCLESSTSKEWKVGSEWHTNTCST